MIPSQGLGHEAGRTRRTRPTTPADLHRLLAVAHERGLVLYQEASAGAWFCTSHSHPGEVYYVTGYSCTCRGFIEHQRCSHHALLLDRLGWLPEIEDEAPAPCLWCAGSGRQEDARNQRFVPCPDCGGSGVRPEVRPHGAPSIQPVAAA